MSNTMLENGFEGFDGFEELDGLNIVQKAELVDVPFAITSIRYELNKAEVEYIYVTCVYQSGDVFTFNDASTGVKTQLSEYLASKGIDPHDDTETPVKILVRGGLRYSEYDWTDKKTGHIKSVRTYYLTTSGKPLTPTTPTKSAPKPAVKR